MTASRWFLLPLTMLLLLASCRHATEPPSQPQVQLSASNIGPTSVWLTIGFAGGGDFSIARDNKTVIQGHLIGNDTTVVDDSLTPGRAYTYAGYKLSNGAIVGTSDQIQVKTMDSTSHEFTWQTFNFGGDAGSCQLFDVAIINDTLAYAVGAIYLRDSTGQIDPNAYNLVKWDGKKWELMRIQFRTFCQQQSTGSYRANAIWAFSDSEVWIASNNSQIAFWNGQTQTGIMCLPVSVTKIWASSRKQVYTVGALGQIGFYNGTSWQKIESGTSLDIQDIAGRADVNTGQQQILSVACKRYVNDHSAVLQISNSGATMVQTTGLPSNVSSIWSPSGKEWYICGDGLYKARSLDSPWGAVPGLPLIYKESIRGNAPNDIFIVGDYGLVSHFNGSSWYTYPSQPGIYYAVATKGNMVVAVGQIAVGGVGGAATILMGRRN